MYIYFEQAIDKKIMALGYGVISAEIATVDTQESHGGGYIVLVTGYLTGKDSVRRTFSQTFFLAPQETGYFVLNDMFRFIDEGTVVHGNQIPVNNVQAPVNTYQGELMNLAFVFASFKSIDYLLFSYESFRFLEVHCCLFVCL